MRDHALFDKIDLHLIRVLSTVLTERRVSQAAIRLPVIAPSASMLRGAQMMRPDAQGLHERVKSVAAALKKE